MKKIVCFICFIFLLMPLFAQQQTDLFNRGIAYLLLEDYAKASLNLNRYFNINPEPTLNAGFFFLLQKKNREAMHQFKNFLDINHRSVRALVGIALSTVGMKNSTSIQNLHRALRLNPRFSPAYLCLALEQFKINNYPLAEDNLQKAIKFSSLPEYKIILARLYLKLKRPSLAVRLVKDAADRYPDNFYFNNLTAQALLDLDRVSEAGQYIRTALEIKPADNDSRLLLAKYHLKTGNIKDARSTLRSIRYKDYNFDYALTYAHTLLKLKDPNAKNHLLQVFLKNKWNKQINYLMALYAQWKKKEENLQNWIYRAAMSGIDPKMLREQFGADFSFPQYLTRSFFNLITVRWISSELIMVAGQVNSGEKERIYFLNPKNLKLVKAFNYNGKLKDIYFSPDQSNMIFSTSAVENTTCWVYSISISNNRIQQRTLFQRPVGMPSITAGFNLAGSLVYFTDKSLELLAFESPFSSVTAFGTKKSLYPNYPFPLFMYNFKTSRISRVKDPGLLEAIPIQAIKKYLLVSTAYLNFDSINNLIKKGEQLDITSSELVKIYFSADLSSFLIYLSDLNNAFQVNAYHGDSNKVYRFDETMFLGAGKYAEIKVEEFLPRNKEIIVRVKDKNRNLLRFNYSSKLTTLLSRKVMDMVYIPAQELVYVLSERSNKIFFNETNLEIISLKPFVSEIISYRRDLNRIIPVTDYPFIRFNTYTGVQLDFDSDNKFTYRGPALVDCLHHTSPATGRTVAFINNRLFIMD